MRTILLLLLLLTSFVPASKASLNWEVQPINKPSRMKLFWIQKVDCSALELARTLWRIKSQNVHSAYNLVDRYVTEGWCTVSVVVVHPSEYNLLLWDEANKLSLEPVLYVPSVYLCSSYNNYCQ